MSRKRNPKRDLAAKKRRRKRQAAWEHNRYLLANMCDRCFRYFCEGDPACSRAREKSLAAIDAALKRLYPQPRWDLDWVGRSYWGLPP